MIKNRLFIVLAVLSLAPNCGWRKKNNDKTVAGNSNSGYNKTQKSVFDEDLEAFVLEEDQNPFSKQGNKKDGSLWNPEDRQGDFTTIYYNFDRYEIRPDQQMALDDNAAKIKDATKQGKTVMLEGHACTAGGSAKYNMTLSEKRAKTAKDYLVNKGVPANKLKTVGRGSEMCKITSGSIEQQAPNRRVEFYILD